MWKFASSAACAAFKVFSSSAVLFNSWRTRSAEAWQSMAPATTAWIVCPRPARRAQMKSGAAARRRPGPPPLHGRADGLPPLFGAPLDTSARDLDGAFPFSCRPSFCRPSALATSRSVVGEGRNGHIILPHAARLHHHAHLCCVATQFRPGLLHPFMAGPAFCWFCRAQVELVYFAASLFWLT